MNVEAALNSAAGRLREAGIAEPRREAASLLAYVLRKDPVFLIAHPEHELTADKSLLFKSVVNRRAKREPFQYIVGRQEFYGLEFEVRPGVLVPRPETEILVEAAVEILSRMDDPHFFEIGVGSGCIVTSILNAVPRGRAEAVDISNIALAVAAQNASRHNVADRLMLRQADLFENATGPFDLVVSNPPYIPDADIETLQPEVRDFEPLAALAAGADGLAVIRRIIRDAPSHLRPGGFLLIEIGYGQAKRVEHLFAAESWEKVDFLGDLQGIARTVRARLWAEKP